MNICIIGLGLMGKAMARNLIAAGHTITGYDLSPAACEEAASIGVQVLSSAPDAAASAPILILSMMTSEDRRRLLWGDQHVAPVLARGTIILDTATARPEDIVEDHARLANQSVRLIDISISGSSEVVSNRQAIALIGDTAGGASDYVETITPFTKAQFCFGSPGQGNQAKLIVNTVMGLNRLVLAEALDLARKGGFDLQTILDVLRMGDTYSVIMDTKGPKMIAGKYEPAVARLEQHAKDVSLICEYARRIGAEAPVSELHARLIAKAMAKGVGPLDNAAIFEAYS